MSLEITTQFPPDNKVVLLPNILMKSANCLLSFQDDIVASVSLLFKLLGCFFLTLTSRWVMLQRIAADSTLNIRDLRLSARVVVSCRENALVCFVPRPPDE